MTVGVNTIYISQGVIFASGVGAEGASTSASYVILSPENKVVSGNPIAGGGPASAVENVPVTVGDTQVDIKRSILAALAIQEADNFPYRVVWIPA